VLAAQSASAQSVKLDRLTPALPTAGEQRAADIASWVTLGAALVLDSRETIGKCDGQDDCYHAITRAALRLGATYGAVELIKRLTHRERPCHANATFTGGTEAGVCGGSDPYASFPSGHTAFAFSTVNFGPARGARLGFSVPLAVSTGGLRIAGGKHWLTDTLAGAGVGLLTSRIR
jgi:membrane-associated phospholipid phosphatase